MNGQAGRDLVVVCATKEINGVKYYCSMKIWRFEGTPQAPQLNTHTLPTCSPAPELGRKHRRELMEACIQYVPTILPWELSRWEEFQRSKVN